MSSMKDALKQAGVVSEKPTRGDAVSKQRNGGGVRRERGGHPRRRQLPELPGSYFMDDGAGKDCLRTAFVSKDNMGLVAEVLGAQLTTGQLRRFFNHCRDIERRLTVDKESWNQVAAGFESLSSHAEYAASNGKIPREFQQFIDANVRRVASSANAKSAFLNGFMPHFEALVGFGARHMKNR